MLMQIHIRGDGRTVCATDYVGITRLVALCVYSNIIPLPFNSDGERAGSVYSFIL